MAYSYQLARQQSLKMVFNSVLTKSYLGAEFMKAYLEDKNRIEISFEGKSFIQSAPDTFSDELTFSEEQKLDLSNISLNSEDEAFLEFAERVKKDFPVVEAVEPVNGNAIEFKFKVS